VEPARDLIAVPGQVTVALGPDLQHRGVVIGGHLPPDSGPQRRDRDGQGIVRVVLVRVPGLQQPDPRGQLGLHVKDPLAGRHQLLGQEPAQPAGALDRPGPLRPARSPPDQLLRLGGAGADPQLTQRFFRSAYRHRRVAPLCGSTPIITTVISTLQLIVTSNGGRGGHA
jgi:hypothetical protein